MWIGAMSGSSNRTNCMNFHTMCEMRWKRVWTLY